MKKVFNFMLSMFTFTCLILISAKVNAGGGCVPGETEVAITVNPDSGFPSDTDWDLIRVSDGAVIFSRTCTDYFIDTTTVDIVCLQDGVQYEFRAKDDWGDGWGDGSWSITQTATGCIIASNPGPVNNFTIGDQNDECAVFDIEDAVTFMPEVCVASGCTDSLALNYDSTAVADDGSCDYPRPVNDDCDSAIVVTEGSATPFDNSFATGVDETPGSLFGFNDTTDIWYMYTATCDGQVTVDVCDANFDATLAVFDACGGNMLVFNDDHESGSCPSGSDTRTSYLVQGTTAGTQYWIRIAGYLAQTGQGTLTVSNCVVTTPIPDECADALWVPMSDTCENSVITTNIGATFSSGAGAPDTTCADGDPAPDDIWFCFTVPASGSVQARFLEMPGLSIVMEVYSGQCGNLTPVGLPCDNYVPGEDILIAGLTPGDTIYLRTWDFFSNDFDTIEFCINEVVAGCTDSFASNYDSTATFDDGSCLYGIPANDECVDCITVTEGSSTPWNNTNATGPDTSSCQSFISGTDTTSIWYCFTASCDGQVMIDLCGTDIDPTLVVYDDCPTNGGVEIACNDDDGPACPGLQSSINLAVTTGTTYYIRVAGWGGEQGSGVLNIGSCAPTTPGCTDSTALNYNPSANLDDGSCDYSQCPYPDTAPVGDVTPTTCDGTPEAFNINAQSIYTVNLVAGNDYVFSICGQWDSQLDLVTSGGTMSLAFNDDFCPDSSGNFLLGSEISYTATTTEVAEVFAYEWECSTISTVAGVLEVSCTAPCVPMNLSLSPTNATAPGAMDGMVDLTISGGTPPYSYLWSDGSTNEDLTGVPAGNYYVTVTDANGCMEMSDTVMVDEDAATCTPCPQATGVTRSSTNSTITLTWDLEPCAVNSQVQHRIKPLEVINNGATTDQGNGLTGAGATSRTLNYNTNNCGYFYQARVRHICGAGGTNPGPWKLMPVVPTSCNKQGKLLGVEIYPNPAQDAFNISFPLADARDITATIFNLMGKEMSATELNAVEGANVFTINVSELASGIYTIVLTNADGTNSSHKFVKH